MAKLPAPPSVERLREIGPDVVTLPRGTLLWRMADAPDGVTDPTLAELLRRLIPAYQPERV